MSICRKDCAAELHHWNYSRRKVNTFDSLPQAAEHGGVLQLEHWLTCSIFFSLSGTLLIIVPHCTFEFVNATSEKGTNFGPLVKMTQERSSTSTWRLAWPEEELADFRGRSGRQIPVRITERESKSISTEQHNSSFKTSWLLYKHRKNSSWLRCYL